MKEPSTFTNQRLYDLVRQQRMELHAADLITNEEYAELAFEHSAVARLEDYDGIRAELAAAKSEVAGLRKGLEDVYCLWATSGLALPWSEMADRQQQTVDILAALLAPDPLKPTPESPADAE